MDVTTLSKDDIIAKDRTLIHGFQRDIEKELSYTTPTEILNLILSYFQLCLHAKNCTFDGSQQLLTVESKYDIAYFTSMISWSKGKHVLEIKCLDKAVTNLGIGICSNYLEGYQYDYFLEAEECGYSYFIKLNRNSCPSLCHFQNGAQKYRRFANKAHHWNSQDSVIRVEYDLDIMQISYYIDDVLQIDDEHHNMYEIRKCDEYYFAFYCYAGNRFEIITCS